MTDEEQYGVVPADQIVVTRGAKSMLSGIMEPLKLLEAIEKVDPLRDAIRDLTLNWLASALAVAAGVPLCVAEAALCAAIPMNWRHLLDGGDTFILGVDHAAMRLGCDPSRVKLRPEQMSS